MSIKVMTAVWEHAKQDGNRLLTLLAIADNANDDGWAYPSQTTLAGKVRVQRRAVQKILDKLETDGDVVIYHRISDSNDDQHLSNFYHLARYGNPKAAPPLDVRGKLVKRVAKTATPGVRTDAGVVSAGTQGSVSTDTGVVSGGTHESSIEPSSNHQDEPPKEKTSSPDGDGGSWQSILEATVKALKFGDYKVATKTAQFLAGRVPERDSRKRSNGDWHALQLSSGMDAVEITAFGVWLASEHGDLEPLRKPETIADYAGRFRADTLGYGRAMLLARLSAQMGTPPAPDAVETESAEDHSAEVSTAMNDLFTQLSGASR